MSRKRVFTALSGATGLLLIAVVALAATAVLPTRASAGNPIAGEHCKDLPGHSDLVDALSEARGADNGGFNLDMWGTIVNRDGEVCAVAYTGTDRGEQWLGSRVISAQKANTANAFSLPGLSLSTANLFSAVQPGGSLFGLQESNPVDTGVAYKGPSSNFGQHNDPMTGEVLGGVNVFGGGLALYNSDDELIGAIGVSGDSSCADHNIAWRTRNLLGLDHVPGGVSGDVDRPDNIVFDIGDDAHGNPESAGGFGHAHCIGGNEANEATIAASLPATS